MSLIIGLGTGRCGTVSLAKLLDSQQDSRVTHEDPPLLPWEGDFDQLEKKLALWNSLPQSFRGDVAFYYLPYVRQIAGAVPSTRFICLRRERHATVASYLKKTGVLNHWYAHEGVGWQQSEWDRCFPKFDCQDKAAAIGMYWDGYYQEAERLADELPNFRIWDMAALNDPETVEDILEFAGFGSKRVLVGVRRNRGNGWRDRMWSPLNRVWKAIARFSPLTSPDYLASSKGQAR